MHQPHKRHDHTPEYHYYGDKNTRPHPLQQDVGDGLKQRIGDEEDCQSEVVLLAVHTQVLVQTGDLGVADVGAVEEGEEVKDAEPGDEGEVEFEEETLVLRCC